MGPNNKKYNSIYYYSIALLISVGLLLLLLLSGDSETETGKENYYFLVVPAAAFFVLKLFQSIVRRIFTGSISIVLEISLHRVAMGSAVFFFLRIMPEVTVLNSISYGVLPLTLIYVITGILSFLKHSVVLDRVVKAVFYIIQGIIYGWMMFSVWHGGNWDMGFNISAGIMVVAGFLVLCICCLLSLMELSLNQKCKSFGRWCLRNLVYKFLLTCAVVLVLKDFRSSIRRSFPDNYVIGEWILICVILIIVFLFLLRRIQNATKPVAKIDLKKHVQEVKFIKGKELANITGYVDQFIQTGEKSHIVISIIHAAIDSNIPSNAISKIMKPIIEYKDIPLRRFFLRSELRLINDQNIETRRKILENIINQLKNLGGKKHE